jgi:HSP20 family protein
MPVQKTDRDYHSYLRTFCGDFMEIGVGPSPGQLLASAPTNVIETEEGYRIQVALPGFRKDQIHLKVEEDILSISAEVKSRKKEEHKKYHKHEIFSSSFQKSILLPEDVDDDDIRASFRDGLLNIELGKSDHPSKSSVEISIH